MLSRNTVLLGTGQLDNLSVKLPLQSQLAQHAQSKGLIRLSQPAQESQVLVIPGLLAKRVSSVKPWLHSLLARSIFPLPTHSCKLGPLNLIGEIQVCLVPAHSTILA